MKIDSEYIDMDMLVEFRNQQGTIKKSNIDFEIWDDGDIWFENLDSSLPTTIKELEEIVRIAKMFKDRRTAYLNKS